MRLQVLSGYTCVYNNNINTDVRFIIGTTTDTNENWNVVRYSMLECVFAESVMLHDV